MTSIAYISWTLMIMLGLLISSFLLVCIGMIVALVGVYHESRRERRIRRITRQYNAGNMSQGEYRRQMQEDNRWG